MEEFRKKFPHLIKELEKEGLPIKGVRIDEIKPVDEHVLKESGPSSIDFIRRCHDEDEALEIITYMESRGEINEVTGKNLRAQLLKGGIRSFGKIKEPGHYEKVRLG